LRHGRHGGRAAARAAAADVLQDVGYASLDAVTTRSALAYVANKPAPFAEFYRVLKPGGRIASAEPQFREDALAVCALKIMVERRTEAVEPPAPLLLRWKAAQFPDTLEKMAASPLTNYAAKILAGFARQAGFTEVSVTCERSTRAAGRTPWKIFLERSPHPWAMPLHEILAERFRAEERVV
jgi:ubiquinone/menaquinone biosynthesis C-methylase UbiE